MTYITRFFSLPGWLASAVFVLALSVAELAGAATRSVAMDLQFIDDDSVAHTYCPGSLQLPNTAGARWVCNQVRFNPIGLMIDVYDRDTSTSDDYIGTYWLNYNPGVITFEWDNAAYSWDGSSHEANPDVYIVMRATISNGQKTVTYQDENGVPLPGTTFREGVVGNPDAFVALNCPTGTQCWIPNVMVPYLESNQDSAFAMGLLHLDSIGHTLALYPNRFDLDFNFRFPVAGIYALAYTRTRMDLGPQANAVAATHEAGHVLQMQNFGQDYLRDDVSLSGPYWNYGAAEYTSAVAAEGWADYVAAVTWWNPNTTDGSLNAYTGFGYIENDPAYQGGPTCNENCARVENSLRVEQAAKAFWDIDDSHQDSDEYPCFSCCGYPDYDGTNLSTDTIAYIWDIFPNGTADHQDYENSPWGVSISDYYYRYEQWIGGTPSSAFFISLIGLNCTGYDP